MIMKKQVLFIHGGGDDGYTADAKMLESLQKALGRDYEVNCPKMPDDENSPDFGWLKQIGKEIGKSRDGLILAGHSLGASMLLKYLSENKISIKITRLFLIAAPFWSGQEDWKQGLKLQDDFAKNIPENIRIFFYHSKDDEEVPFKHLSVYKTHLPEASFTEIEKGGHQLDNDLSIAAEDIMKNESNF